MPIVTAADISKLVDALTAEQDKCTRLATERAALIDALMSFAVSGERFSRSDCEAAYQLLRSMGELEEK